MRALLATILSLFLVLPAAAADRPLTLLISIDAFRPDYLERGVTPVLSKLAAEGVRAAMRPSFPSKTFPNHYTLVTGRRPDKNGIVSNNMRDAGMPGVSFSMSNRAAVTDRRWWDEAEPIWVTAERAGIRTAPIYWPGSEAEIHGVRPHDYRAFDQAVTSDQRVDFDLALLGPPAGERPQFMTLYFDVVDTAGHYYGPASPEVNAAAAEVDRAVGRLLEGLASRGVVANVVIVSDHGMAAVAPDRRLFIDDWLSGEAYFSTDLGPVGAIFPKPGHEAEVEAALLAPREHLQCWKKADIPKRFHYGKNPRVAPIFCLPETGWRLTTRGYRSKNPEGGEHGYDNRSPEMAATFVANGPAFRKGVELKAFDNVDVYPLLARLVGVKPQHSDGRLSRLESGLTP